MQREGLTIYIQMYRTIDVPISIPFYRKTRIHNLLNQSTLCTKPFFLNQQ